jgi:uncharacterized protein YdaU (DUF1376 family)
VTKKADTWMPWYVADYLADTAHLNTEQHGAYCLMLMAAWKSGGALPNDDGQLSSVCRLTPAKWKASKAILLKFFTVSAAEIVHKRVALERVKAQAISDKKAENGKEGAKKRWQKDSKPMANAIANQSQIDAPSPSPTHLPTEDSVPNGTDGDAVLTKQELWSAGKSLLAEQGMPKAQCGTFVGKLVKDYRDEVVIDAVRSCVVKRPADAAQYLVATCKHLSGQRQKLDIAKTTVPGKQERDPELIKAENDSKNRAPMPAHIREQAAKIKQGAAA